MRLPYPAARHASLAAATCAFVAALAPFCASAAGLDYPQTEKIDQVDVYHGVEVADPYRWLEDDVRTSDAVADWVERQNEVTFGYLETIPERDELRRRLTELWDYERVSAPDKRGGRYFSRRNDGLQPQAVVYVQDSLVEEPRVLLDPNGWSADGTVALAGMAVSPDGCHAAYGVAEAGSDWTAWRVVDIDSGELLDDEIRWVKYSGAEWTKDGKGFFYGRFPEPKEGEEFQESSRGQALWYHRLGTPQSADTLVYERPENPDWLFAPEVTEDGRWLIVSIGKSTSNNRLYVRDLTDPYALPRPIVDHFDHDYRLVHNRGETFYVFTDDDAPRGRVVAIDLARPEPEHWRDVLPQGEATLRGANVVGNLLFASFLEDAKTVVRVFTLDGKPVREVELPGIGSAFGFGGEASDTETFYTFTSFAMPPTVYRYDVVSGESTLWRRPEVDVDPDDYEVEQVFYPSKDGTRVPMFLVHKKGVEADGANPTLLYGYGGFNVSLTPFFSVERLAWLERGGVYAVANLRGGGEYGEEWHLAGTKTGKQNVFDDFIAAAEWLVDNRWTKPAKLAIAGGSNGGLLVGAAMTQRPDLFGAALPAVGVMDMLRFHHFTAGRFWVDDYGTADDPEQFRALYAYSPYHNLEPGTDYPPTLVTTADHDDRVVPGHSFKFAARLQAMHGGDDPVLIRIESRAGHGAGQPTEKRIEAAADQLAFLVENLDMRPEVPAIEVEGGNER
jgi:prolyl oligopeptidase